MIKNILLSLFTFALLAYPQTQTIHGGEFNAGQADSTTPATIGWGAPSSSTCAGVAHRGRVFTRLDPASISAALYVCLESSSGSGVFAWTVQSGSSAYTVGTGPNNLVQLNGSSQLPAVSGALLTNLPKPASIATPASAAASCTAGTIAADTSYIYVCVATDTWLRGAIVTWP